MAPFQLAACASGARAESPRDALDAYAVALKEGDVEAAYSRLSEDAKKSITFEAFARMVRENPRETLEIAESLGRQTEPPRVVATVTSPSGESILLVYEGGRWRVDASAIDLYSQATPEEAVRSFLRAFKNQRYDVLLRFVPDAMRDGLTADKLKKEWQGEQRDEMEHVTQALATALPTARVELIGDRAIMEYGTSGTLELVREHGLWRIEEFR